MFQHSLFRWSLFPIVCCCCSSDVCCLFYSAQPILSAQKSWLVAKSILLILHVCVWVAPAGEQPNTRNEWMENWTKKKWWFLYSFFFFFHFFTIEYDNSQRYVCTCIYTTICCKKPKKCEYLRQFIHLEHWNGTITSAVDSDTTTTPNTAIHTNQYGTRLWHSKIQFSLRCQLFQRLCIWSIGNKTFVLFINQTETENT